MITLVGSKNPAKLEAVTEAFAHYFKDNEIISRSVASGVSDNPLNDEVYQGALNRATALSKINEEESLGASYFVGQEGGIAEIHGRWYCRATMCVMDAGGNTGFGWTNPFELPERIYSRILKGEELGPLMDELAGRTNTKLHEGANAYFTKDVILRKDLYVPALVTAMVPFLHQDLFR